MGFLESILGAGPMLWMSFWFGFAEAIRRVIASVEDAVGLEYKEKLSKGLRGVQERPVDDWVYDFGRVFDKIYGKNHLSLRCFLTSTLVSILSFMIIALVWIGQDVLWLDVQNAFIYALILNVIPDYISLLETRWLLGVKRIPMVIKLIIDVILSYILLAVSVFGIAWATGYQSADAFEFFTSSLFLMDITFEDPETPSFIEVCFFATITSYTTSIWLWLHGFAHMMVRFLYPFKWLEVEEKPLRAVGVVMSVLLIAIGCVGAVVIQLQMGLPQ